MRKALLLAFCFSFSIGSAAEYKGNVGKMDAVFDLEWPDDGPVRGSYYYPARPDVRYQLVGTNPEEGKIVLGEFTGNQLSARCVLTKRLTETEIIWSGRMYNTDGREFAMQFSRPRGVALPPPPEPEETGYEIDRTLDVEKVVPVLGKPGELEAHLYGRLYYGWTISGVSGEGDPAYPRVNRFRHEGTLVWAAMRFEEDQVELQYEATDGLRHTLKGNNPVEGRIVIQDEKDRRWTLNKYFVGEAIVWIGESESIPKQSLLIYRPVDRIYHGSFESMKRLAPEAFLWEFNEWGQPFHSERFAYRYGNELAGTVESINESGGLVSSFILRLEDGRRETISLDPPRPRNRVPVASGFPVSASFRDGKVACLVVGLTPIAWRQRGDHTLELKLFATEMAGITWDDFGDPVFPPGRVDSLEKIELVPDYAILADDIYASWFIPEDKITWGIGDRGAGILELESLSLDEEPSPSPPASGRIGPWQPITTPVDFITNQLRIVHMSTTSMFGRSLPGNE